MTFKTILFLYTAALSLNLNAKPLVVTTLPEFAYLVSEIAQDKIEVKSLLVGSENPHYLDVRPDFISILRKASLVCFNGLELEVGWLPKSIQKSANTKIKQNSDGWCDLGSQINPIDKISSPTDRSMGDVHAAGNPHYNLSLKQILLVLNYLNQKLIDLMPEEKLFFTENKNKLTIKVSALDKLISQKFDSLKQKNAGSLKFSQYHKEFSYLFKDYNITEGISIEEKPGISPSAGRLQKVAAQLKNDGIQLIVATDDTPISTLEKIKEFSGTRYVVLPRGFNTDRQINNYEKLYSEILKLISSALKK